uniref:AlNc14C303G10415 protein n=1 Tax=Albugo laibachii Nc14 TaxID=890382 RepID=F0WVS9_9STRA|nr:AlNc14C303G10415 [Albugo laibachii Nc14]|eukprot:CCA25526.1 AlNc14C303G10415 [Albugo laibachii Nc14]
MSVLSLELTHEIIEKLDLNLLSEMMEWNKIPCSSVERDCIKFENPDVQQDQARFWNLQLLEAGKKHGFAFKRRLAHTKNSRMMRGDCKIEWNKANVDYSQLTCIISLIKLLGGCATVFIEFEK